MSERTIQLFGFTLPVEYQGFDYLGYQFEEGDYAILSETQLKELIYSGMWRKEFHLPSGVVGITTSTQKPLTGSEPKGFCDLVADLIIARKFRRKIKTEGIKDTIGIELREVTPSLISPPK